MQYHRFRGLFLGGILWLVLTSTAWGLTTAQLQTLKTDITVTRASTVYQGQTLLQWWNGGADQTLADFYNQLHSPAFWVYRTNVSIVEIGNAFDGAELAGLTTGNQTRLQTLAQYSAGGIDASLANRRAFFDDVFSGAGGTTTRANLAVLWRRQATYGERLYATGTGSTGAPGTLTVETLLTATDIMQARGV